MGLLHARLGLGATWHSYCRNAEEELLDRSPSPEEELGPLVGLLQTEGWRERSRLSK